jgi:hypothetical protein
VSEEGKARREIVKSPHLITPRLSLSLLGDDACCDLFSGEMLKLRTL